MNEIMISVLCTAYNHEKYIKDALDGFIKQKTSFKYEVIVNDDASTDHTASILHEYESKYPDIIKPIYQKVNQYQQGKLITQDILLPRARGKYLAFCEGDDYWTDENKLQIQFDFLETHNEYVACTHNTEFLQLNSGKKTLRYGNISKELLLADCAMQGSQSFQTSSLIVRRDVFLNRPDFTKSVNGVGDYPNSIYYALSGKIWYFSNSMSVYRVGSEGSWSNTVSRDHRKKIQIVEASIKMLRMADEYSNHQYKEVFENAIDSQKYQLDIASQNFKKVIKNNRFYKKEDFRIKLRYFLYAYFPFIIRMRNRIREGK